MSADDADTAARNAAARLKAERIRDGRMYFRRGYAAIDAAGNVGLAVDVLWEHLSPQDHRDHEAVWNYGPGHGWTA